MTAPAEDPRGGECQQSDWCGPGSHCLCPPAAGRGDTDSGGEGDCFDVCQGHPTGDKRATDGGMRDYFDAQAAELAAELDEPAARPAGDRAQPTQELREALVEALWGADVRTATAAQTTADALLAGPLAALLDAQAAASRVEALASDWAQSPTAYRAAEQIRRALDGTT